MKMRLVTALLLTSAMARAEDPAVVAAQQAQVESLRAEVAGQVQLQAYDLLDELVYGWTTAAPFAVETPVVLADVSVPVGFGSGLQALVENHFISAVLKNPRTHVTLAHCPQCTAMTVRSGAKGTVIARGVDEPETLAAAGALSGSRHALFLDFELEGASLVLRARITSLEPALPIVYAKTLTTSTSSPALLRSEDHLKSASEARKEYLDALQGRSLYVLPARVGIRTYKAETGAPVVADPFFWLQLGAEAALSQSRAWTGSVSVGFSWTPQLHTAYLVQARISRLLTGSVTSLTHPDVYGFLGASVISVHGPGALLFRDGAPTVADIEAALTNGQPQSTFAAFQIGLEVRIKNRLGAAVFTEASPALNNARAIGNYLDLGVVRFQSLGAEVSVCF